jgi:nicotinic acid mononucleotide adenylyltransferase
MTNWGEVTAVFGGRFDPIHNGHLAAINGLFEEPGSNRLSHQPRIVSS